MLDKVVKLDLKWIPMWSEANREEKKTDIKVLKKGVPQVDTPLVIPHVLKTEAHNMNEFSWFGE